MLSSEKWVLLTINGLIGFLNCEMDGRVVGGEYASIIHFPHSVSLSAVCGKSWVCGASILNQRVLLTAAHCVDTCNMATKRKHSMNAYAGHEDLTMVRITRNVIDVIMHEEYDVASVGNDIAVAMVKDEIPLNNNVKRVILTGFWYDPLRNGFVAGWGLVNETTLEGTVKLKSVNQKIRSKKTCSLISSIQPGMFCAGSTDPKDPHPSAGDSGSALVVKEGYAIGLVSFRINRFPALMVYTNVTHYYSWIRQQAEKLYCRNA